MDLSKYIKITSGKSPKPANQALYPGNSQANAYHAPSSGSSLSGFSLSSFSQKQMIAIGLIAVGVIFIGIAIFSW